MSVLSTYEKTGVLDHFLKSSPHFAKTWGPWTIHWGGLVQSWTNAEVLGRWYATRPESDELFYVTTPYNGQNAGLARIGDHLKTGPGFSLHDLDDYRLVYVEITLAYRRLLELLAAEL